MSNKGNVVCCYLFIVLSKLQRPSSNILLDTKLTKILLLKSLLENAWFTFLSCFHHQKGTLTLSRYHAVFLLPWFLCCRSGYQSTNLPTIYHPDHKDASAAQRWHFTILVQFHVVYDCPIVNILHLLLKGWKIRKNRHIHQIVSDLGW